MRRPFITEDGGLIAADTPFLTEDGGLIDADTPFLTEDGGLIDADRPAVGQRCPVMANVPSSGNPAAVHDGAFVIHTDRSELSE